MSFFYFRVTRTEGRDEREDPVLRGPTEGPFMFLIINKDSINGLLPKTKLLQKQKQKKKKFRYSGTIITTMDLL